MSKVKPNAGLSSAGGQPDLRLFDAAKETGDITPVSAFNQLSAFFGRYVSIPGRTEEYKTVNADMFLDAAGAKKTYIDSRGVARGYSLPKEFSILGIDYPCYNHAFDPYTQMSSNIGMISFCIGLARTPHDPKTGSVNRFWTYSTGPSINYDGMEPWERNISPDHYVYHGNDVTSWCRFHMLFPKAKKPYLLISALQNERLELAPETEAEFIGLYQSANSSWRKFYRPILESLSGSGKSPSEVEYFAYPNRHLLLPLVGLCIGEQVGAKELVIQFPPSHPGNYLQSYNFLKDCNTMCKVSLSR